MKARPPRKQPITPPHGQPTAPLDGLPVSGQMMRRLRYDYGEPKHLDDLAAAASVDAKGIRDRWERKGETPDFKKFWAYVKVLRREAVAKNLLARFEKALHEVVKVLYPELDELWKDARGTGDPRTREEFWQDLVDSTKGFDVTRPSEIRKIPDLLSRLPRGPDPAVLTRSQIEEPDSWETLREKAFEVRMVFPVDTSTIQIHRSGSAARSPLLLSVDLRDQNYGVYSEAGKRRVREQFIKGSVSEILTDADQTIHEFLMQISERSDDLYWRNLMKGALIPLRWASAGVLPVVRRLTPGVGQDGWVDDGQWVALFFRDIPPVGLNLGNGASEKILESLNLEELIRREFAEELILVNQNPKTRQDIRQFVFHDVTGGRVLAGPDVYRKFVERHHQLRKSHDGLNIYVGNDRRFLTPMHTPFAVRVIDKTWQENVPDGVPQEQTTRCLNVIFTLNPGELGIEVIRPYKFDLRDDEWLMDGEILPSSVARYPYLVRRPIVMIRVDFLKELFRKNKGSLGVISRDPNFLGGKTLPEIPSGMFRVLAEIEPRKKRLSDIQEKLSHPENDEEKRALEAEHKLIHGWLGQYERIFEEAQSGNKPLKAEAVRTLCPVTYKTIELCFRHDCGF